MLVLKCPTDVSLSTITVAQRTRLDLSLSVHAVGDGQGRHFARRRRAAAEAANGARPRHVGLYRRSTGARCVGLLTLFLTVLHQSPFLLLLVRRESIVEDALHQVSVCVCLSLERVCGFVDDVSTRSFVCNQTI